VFLPPKSLFVPTVRKHEVTHLTLPVSREKPGPSVAFRKGHTGGSEYPVEFNLRRNAERSLKSASTVLVCSSVRLSSHSKLVLK
jgi:hypothetical protein